MKTVKNELKPFDFKKEYKALFAPKGGNTPQLLEIPPFKYLMIDGEGNPEGAEFGEKTQVLYGVAYGIKFIMKKETPSFDFVVPPLSGLWDAEDKSAFTEMRKERWQWTLMAPMPDMATETVFHKAVAELRRKKNPRFLETLRFGIYEEGLCAQTLHTGPYSAEAPVIENLHRFIADQGYAPSGKHHEIYLSDPRRTLPEKLKTILRQPVRKIQH